MPGYAGRAVIKPFLLGPAGVIAPMAWYRADSIKQADQSRVVQWDDLSGNGYHVSNATTLSQPVLKLNIQNGQPCVRFDGTDDQLTSNLQPTAGADNWTMFVVGVSTVAGTCVPVFVGGTNGWGLVLSSNTDTSKIGFLRGNLAWHNSLGIGANFTNVRMLSGVRNNGTFRLWKSGGAVALTTTAAPYAPTPKIQVGGHDLATANLQPLDIYEAIIYDRALTDAEIDLIGNYLKDRYAIPYTNIVHPYGVPDVFVWFDASDTASITSSAGAVSSWADKMGVRHGVQATASAKPTTDYESVNGLNAIRFAGDDYLQYSASTGLVVGDVTIFMIALQYTSRDSGGFFSTWATGDTYDFVSPNSFYLDTSTTAYWIEAVRYFSDPNGRARYTGSGLMPLAVWQVRFNNSGLIEVWRNNTAGTNSTRAGTFGHASAGFLIGGRYLNGIPAGNLMPAGLMCEILVYNRSLANFERDQIRSTLYAKWGIAP